MKTKSLLFTLIMMLCIVKISSAQIMFQKTYGKKNWNEGFSVEQTSDSGFIFAGYTKNIYDISTNAYLIKTNESGDTLWTKLYSGTHYNYGISVQQTTDGGFIMGTCYGDATLNAYLIKTNSNGDTLWTKGYGGILDDNINSVQQTTDGGYIILGTTKSFGAGASDIYVIKTDFKGDTIWTKAYGGTNMEDCASIRQTDDDGYIIAGFTNSFGAGNTDVYVIKIDSNGAVMWSKTYGSHTVDYGRSAMQTSDGGYIIAGFRYNLPWQGIDIYLIKTDAIGDTLWTKNYGTTSDEEALAVIQTSDGGYMITGSRFYSPCNTVYLLKTNANGEIIWTRIFGGTLSTSMVGNSIQQTMDGGYIIGGSINSCSSDNKDMLLIKTDSNGNSNCSQSNVETITYTDSTKVSSPATIVTNPATMLYAHSVAILRGGKLVNLCTVSINEIATEPNSLSIFPNPTTSDNFTLQLPPDFTPATLQIFNAHGAMVYEQSITQASTLIHLNKAAGIYFVKVDDGEKVVMGKLIVE